MKNLTYEQAEEQEFYREVKKIQSRRCYGPEFKEDFSIFEDFINSPLNPTSMKFLKGVIYSYIVGDYYITSHWKVERRVKRMTTFLRPDSYIDLCIEGIIFEAFSIEFGIPSYWISKTLDELEYKFLLDSLMKYTRDKINDVFSVTI